ncbi:MAG: WecB/TagA/CpsF family glycosyltransferase [Thermomicrobiales bacterium]|nr:WecB/TagA/CpsF family glycosyltransferase [Thermomicrobiales bacterium]
MSATKAERRRGEEAEEGMSWLASTSPLSPAVGNRAEVGEGSLADSLSASPPFRLSASSTDILGVPIDAVDLESTVAAVEHYIAARDRQYLAVCAVHSIMEAADDPAFHDILARAALRVPDGMPLVWLSRRAGNRHVGRVRGADLVDALCARSAKTGHRHYFYGGGPGIAQEMAARLQQRHPGLQVAGAATPGQLAIGQEEAPDVIDAINHAQPDILWVGLGCPKQEWWTHLHRPRLHVPVVIPVGAAFDFHSGAVKQAPMWMQRNGLEWVHRTLQDPYRLSGRYLGSVNAVCREIWRARSGSESRVP